MHGGRAERTRENSGAQAHAREQRRTTPDLAPHLASRHAFTLGRRLEDGRCHRGRGGYTHQHGRRTTNADAPWMAQRTRRMTSTPVEAHSRTWGGCEHKTRVGREIPSRTTPNDAGHPPPCEPEQYPVQRRGGTTWPRQKPDEYKYMPCFSILTLF